MAAMPCAGLGRACKNHRAARRFAALAGAALASTGLAGCSWGPFESLSSLSPAVRADTLGYNDAVGDASDRILLSNVLRAKDLAPINLSQLSTLSGTLTLQGTLGFSLPWGHATTNGQNTGTPSVTGSTTPTYTLSPLNTQGFMLSILQPVSASYVLNRWQAGMPRELLLLLYVKEIDFPAGTTPDGKNTTERYINDPDDPAHFSAFLDLVKTLIAANAQLKAFDILDPIGPPFSLYAAVTPPANTPPPPNPIPATNADQTGFGLITGNNDGQYHAGNAPVGKADTTPPGKSGQLYRVYAGQVELCADAEAMKNAHFTIPEIAPSLPGAKGLSALELSQQTTGLAGKIAAFAMAPSTGGGAPTGPGGGGHGAPAGGGPAAATSGQAMTAALQAGRVSALVDAAGCQPDEILLKPFSEDQFQLASQKFVHIQWRSVSEMFDYLGAILRYNDSTGEPFPFTTEPDLTVAGSPGKERAPIFFAVRLHGPGHLSVTYNDRDFAVADIDPKAPTADYTRPILGMLSTLVDYSAQPSTVSTSAPLRLLPIP